MALKVQTASADLELFPNLVIKRVDLELQRPPHNGHVELEILKNLTHKNIIPLLDSQVTQGYITFKFPRYKWDLNQYMDDAWKSNYNPYLLNNANKIYTNTIPLKDSREILAQISDALTYIHSNGIIHRDVKPHNIMLNSCNEVVLGDFGISYNRDLSDSSKTCDCSTSIYKAPELLFSISDYRFEIDIWALAIVMTQLWNDKTESKSVPSKVIDINLEECSDIRLVLTLLKQFGKPSDSDWPQIENNESFHGMFGSLPDGTYLHRKPITEQLTQVYNWMPLIKDEPQLAELWLRMVIFNSKERISSKQISKLI